MSRIQTEKLDPAPFSRSAVTGILLRQEPDDEEVEDEDEDEDKEDDTGDDDAADDGYSE
jgi:hypothetical protein